MGQQLTRSATLRWTTDPPGGVGRVSVASGAFAALAISLAEGDPHPRESTPGELLASALAGYLGMHLALRMQRHGTPLRELVVEVQLSITPWPSYTTRTITFAVRGRPGDGKTLTGEEFAAATREALDTATENMGLRPGLIQLGECELA